MWMTIQIILSKPAVQFECDELLGGCLDFVPNGRPMSEQIAIWQKDNIENIDNIANPLDNPRVILWPLK
jgi:hypothetical protein